MRLINPYIIPGLQISIDISEIIKQGCGYNSKFNIDRSREVYYPRICAITLHYLFTTLSLTKIGYIYKKDPSSIINSINTVSNGIQTNNLDIIKLFVPVFEELYGNHVTKLNSVDKISDKKLLSDILFIEKKLNKYPFVKELVNKYNSKYLEYLKPCKNKVICPKCKSENLLERSDKYHCQECWTVILK